MHVKKKLFDHPYCTLWRYLESQETEASTTKLQG